MQGERAQLVAEALTLNREYRESRSSMFNKILFSASEIYRSVRKLPSMEALKMIASDELDDAIKGNMTYNNLVARNIDAFKDPSDRLSQILQTCVDCGIIESDHTPKEEPSFCRFL